MKPNLELFINLQSIKFFTRKKIIMLIIYVQLPGLSDFAIMMLTWQELRRAA